MKNAVREQLAQVLEEEGVSLEEVVEENEPFKNRYDMDVREAQEEVKNFDRFSDYVNFLRIHRHNMLSTSTLRDMWDLYVDAHQSV